MIDDALLAILACPACQGDMKLLDTKSDNFISSKPAGLSERSQQYKIVCAKCGRRYPIKNGVPVLLADESERPAQ